MPNPGFENWSATWPNNRPLNYNTIDTVGMHSAFKTTDKFSGNYALKVMSLDTMLFGIYNVKFPGVATFGRIHLDGTVDKGIPFTEKPDNLRGYYKYLPTNTDTMNVIVYFWKYNAVLQKKDTLGGAVLDTSATISTYTYFDLPIKWDSNSTETPDSMNIVLLSSTYVIQNHSSAFFDEFSFYYSPTGWAQPLDEILNDVYPNPVQDVLNLNNDTDSEVFIYSLTGKLIMNRKLAEPNYLLDVSLLPHGAYILKVQNAHKVRVSKIILE